MKREASEKRGVFSGNLILVNGEHPYREELNKVSLSPVYSKSAVRMDSEAALMLGRLMDRLGGWKEIAPVSGWRSMGEQENIWRQSMEENGADFTGKFVAWPGHSEHQTGLAIDLGQRAAEIDFIRPSFPDSGICGDFRRNAAEFGFIERYPQGKEKITGIAHEPWHFRYVGAPHSEIIAETGLTLEEYIELLKGFPFGGEPFRYDLRGRTAEIFFIPDGETTPEPKSGYSYSVSGNNADGFIITALRDV